MAGCVCVGRGGVRIPFFNFALTGPSGLGPLGYTPVTIMRIMPVYFVDKLDNKMIIKEGIYHIQAHLYILKVSMPSIFH